MADRSSKKEREKAVVDAIEKICSSKATYGSPRVRAVLERDYGFKLSLYMVRTIMKEKGLLVSKTSRRRHQREHSGKVSVNRPNTRWASDITSIKCWDGSKIRLAFILDCCDRSIISWKIGITMQASDIEQLLQKALFDRFGGDIPNGNGIEFLHDNGPEYIEKTLQGRMKGWGVKDCRTPTYSPQSNGMCEAFNGTFKRDYVYQSCLDDYETVEGQMEHWFNEYNTYAPHSALQMKTPSQYYKEFQSAA